MKTRQSNLSIWAMAALISSTSFVACAQATPTRYGGARVSTATIDSGKIKLLQPLQQTVAKIKKLSATGDPDFDYSFQAKLHAQGLQDFRERGNSEWQGYGTHTDGQNDVAESGYRCGYARCNHASAEANAA